MNEEGQTADASQWIALAGLDTFVVRRDGQWLQISDTLLHRLGYSDFDQFCKRVPNAAQLFAPEQVGQFTWSTLANCKARGVTHATLRGSTGEQIRIRLRFEPDANDLYVTGIVYVDDAPDLGNLNLPDSLYRLLLHRSQTGIFVFDHARVLFANEAFAQGLGYRINELQNLDLREVVDSEEWPAFETLFSDQSLAPNEYREFMTRLRVRGGIGRRFVSLKASHIDYAGMPAYVGTTFDVTELHRGEDALRDYARRLRLLSRQILDVQENERRHLARELHDEFGQQLTMIRLTMERIEKMWPGGNPPHGIVDVVEAVTSLTGEIRSLSLDLRPSMLDDLGLAATVRWYAGRTIGMSGIQLALTVADDFPRLDTEIETTFFRIAQEAITNALRHSGAKCIEVSLDENDDEFCLRIVDDGRGFEVERAGLRANEGLSAGVLGMQERAGLIGADLILTSDIGAGTALRLSYPKRGNAEKGRIRNSG